MKFYLYVLEQNGIVGATGLLEYPRLHKTTEVLLTTPDREAIGEMLVEIEKIINREHCPERIPKAKCKNCSYFDFCYAEEV